MHRIYVPNGRDASNFRPVVYGISPQGELYCPMSEMAPIPDGYERKEVRTFREYEQFCHLANRIEGRKMDEKLEMDQRWLEHVEGINRRDLFNMMANGGSIEYPEVRDPHTGKLIPSRRVEVHFSEQMKDVVREFIRRNNERRPRLQHAGVHVEAFEMDASNRTAYSDRAIGWKNRK